MKKILKYILLLFIAITFVHSSVIQMEQSEIIQRSKTIFIGTVATKVSRWNNKGNLIVTDYTFLVEDVLFGNTDDKVILTFAGGQLAEEGQSLSGVPEFKVGDRVLLMLEEGDTPLLSPVTGMYQGKYSSVYMPSHGKEMAFDSHNFVVKNKDGKRLSFDEFVLEIKKEIPIAKSRPLPDRKVPIELEKYILKNLPSKVYDQSAKVDSVSQKVTKPKRNEKEQRITPQSSDSLSEESANNYYLNQNKEDGIPGEAPEYWAYSHRAKNVPIVFNPLPSGGLIGDHDQYQMSYWNDYANIFQVYTTPTGTWAWRNDRYDIAGFVDNQTMIDQFGQGWGSSTLAICWKRWDETGFSIEADIAMNPAFSWTTDDYTIYRNPNLFNADRTLLHEIGHSWGLDHQWDTLSVMNYAPHKYRAYNVLYVDDIAAIRAAFPSEAVGGTDLGVSLFFPNGSQNYDDSTLSVTSVVQGGSFSVDRVILENTGTSTVTTPEIDWYLVPTINNWLNYRFLQTTTHASLPSNSSFITGRTLTVPASVPAGTYYLGAFIGNAEDSIGNNNSTWLDRLITVVDAVPTPSTPSASDGTYPDKVRISWSNVSGATTYKMYRCTDTGTNSCSYLASDSVTPYDDTGATPGVIYYYRIKASNAAGDSAYSDYDTGSLQAEVTPEARAALVALYNSTGGNDWLLNGNWNIGDPCGDYWYGVECNGTNVTGLDLAFNDLIGSIPAEIRNLTNLTSLNLSYNQLTGTIPAGIFIQPNLQILNLSNNQLTGSIPALILLPNLQILNLSSNQLTGTIPVFIENLILLFDNGGLALETNCDFYSNDAGTQSFIVDKSAVASYEEFLGTQGNCGASSPVMAPVIMYLLN